MKWKPLIGLAVASAFASGGALASSFNLGTEVQTPISVNESAPSRALEDSGHTMTMPSHTHHDEVAISDAAFGTGASSTESASGVIGFDSSVGSTSSETVDYWRMDESSDAGSASSSVHSSMSSSELADQVAMSDDAMQIGSVTTFYGNNLARLLDTGIDSGEREA